MSGERSSIYAGRVVHKRLSPRRHAFAYRVFNLCLDVDEIEEIDRASRLFSRGRFNLIGFDDRDYARGDGERIADQVRRMLGGAGLAAATDRISMLTYPRMLGYVFNPLTVYFCADAAGRLGAIVYEVTNTFRERRSYVLPVAAGADRTIAQHCAKELYVSPFTASGARYGFHVRPPGDDVVVGVDLREDGRPVLKTHFAGRRLPFDDRTLARLALTHPLLTMKVVGAIHLEALRLWLKGVPLQARYGSPPFAVTVVGTGREVSVNG